LFKLYESKYVINKNIPVLIIVNILKCTQFVSQTSCKITCISQTLHFLIYVLRELPKRSFCWKYSHFREIFFILHFNFQKISADSDIFRISLLSTFENFRSFEVTIFFNFSKIFRIFETFYQWPC
jgi:hypothetical protein